MKCHFHYYKTSNIFVIVYNFEHTIQCSSLVSVASQRKLVFAQGLL